MRPNIIAEIEPEWVFIREGEIRECRNVPGRHEDGHPLFLPIISIALEYGGVGGREFTLSTFYPLPWERRKAEELLRKIRERGVINLRHWVPEDNRRPSYEELATSGELLRIEKEEEAMGPKFGGELAFVV